MELLILIVSGMLFYVGAKMLYDRAYINEGFYPQRVRILFFQISGVFYFIFGLHVLVFIFLTVTIIYK